MLGTQFRYFVIIGWKKSFASDWFDLSVCDFYKKINLGLHESGTENNFERDCKVCFTRSMGVIKNESFRWITLNQLRLAVHGFSFIIKWICTDPATIIVSLIWLSYPFILIVTIRTASVDRYNYKLY